MIRFSSLSISDEPTLLNEKLGIFFNLLLISKTPGWFLYLFIAFSTELILLLSVSVPFISKRLVAFLKNLLSSSETKWSSKIVFSLLSRRLYYLTTNLTFFKEKRLYIFPKTFIVTGPSWIKSFEI